MHQIYIASSWKNQHAVEMLTSLLEEAGYGVLSFIRNSFEENLGAGHKNHEDPEDWYDSDNGWKAYDYDTAAAKTSDMTIYLGPSGIDAWIEVATAKSAGKPTAGLWAKGETVGNNRKIVDNWFNDYRELLAFVSYELPTTAIPLEATFLVAAGRPINF